MKQTTKRLSSTLIALLLLVAGLLVFFELIQPEYGNLITLKGQAESEQALLANEQKLVSQAEGVLSSYNTQSAAAQQVNLAMPIGQNNAEALAQFYGLAANSGLSIQSIGISAQTAPQKTPAQGGATSSASSAASLVKSKNSIVFQVAATGSYEALKTFLQGLESNVRVFDVTGLSIRSVTAVSGTGSTQTSLQDIFNFGITAVAYYQSS